MPPTPPAPPADGTRLEERRALVPAITYPEALPITERRDELLGVLHDHQVVVVAGETGSGKSTQLPKLCLEIGRGVAGLIGHTQPRRVAARSIAERIAAELGSELGDAVGYTVRFTDRVSDSTLVKVMTDGILLAEIQRDRMLSRYDTLIIDEAHERTLNIDFLLGYVKQLLPRRPDLHVVITSATIDTARFAAHFDDAPVVEVTGRTYPVDIRYRPFGEEPDDERDQVQAVCNAIDELSAEGSGDVLVFLSGEREIHDTADALRRLDRPGTEVLPLYARLSAAEQHRIFEPHRGRRIVLSTNVAETSLTVPGVRYVVDAGAARISRYSHRLKVQRLPIEPISRASADQRAGRCGRVAPGICIRLYGEEDYGERPEFTEPEILRTNLASVILQMTALGLGDVAGFPFLDPPDARAIRDGIALLEELGALDLGRPGELRLTRLGRQLAQLPIDPRLGRMVLEADRQGCVREVMVIAAALSIQDPRERPAAALQEASDAHRRFEAGGSDFLAFVGLWDHLREQQRALSSSQFRKLCRNEFLNYLRVREWQDLYSQLRRVAGGLGVRPGDASSHPDHVHRAILAGLLSHLGLREGTSREFRGARGAKFALVPGSVLAKKPPRWVMAGELVETTRLWGRVAARVQPEWAEQLGAHLVKRSYGEPAWDAERGAAVTVERATLYGLPIVAGRRVGYDRVDRAMARELFIRHALVEGDWSTHHDLIARNRAFLEELRALEDRVRHRHLLVDDERVEAFYDARIGPDVVSGRHFDRWWNTVRGDRPDLLTLTLDALTGGGPAVHVSDYPDEWRQGDLVLPVTYRFDPGAPDDGATVHVPVAVLNQVPADGFEWGVPGFREDLVAALVRSLPKPIRRHLVPIADTARAAAERVAPDDGSLGAALALALTELAAVDVAPGDFDISRVPDHLRITFAVEDDDGQVLATGKDLDLLRRQLSGRTRTAIARAALDVERAGVTEWDLGTLPRVVEVERAGRLIRGYPALLDEGDSVSVRVLTSEDLQRRVMRLGTRRLLLLAVPVARKPLERQLSNAARLAVARVAGSVDEIVDDCITAAADQVVDEHGGPAWDEEGFAELRRAGREQLAGIAARAVVAAGRVAVEAAAVEAQLDRLIAPALRASVEDTRAHVRRLVRPGFVRTAGTRRLDDLLRYVRAIGRRLEKVGSAVAADQRRMAEVHPLERRYRELLDRLPPSAVTSDVVECGWMLEELRVSLFAQVLGTSGPVSVQRVSRDLDRLGQSSGPPLTATSSQVPSSST